MQQNNIPFLPLKRDGIGSGRYLTLDGRFGIGVGDDTWTDANGNREGSVDWTVWCVETDENLFDADTLTECREWLARQLHTGRLR